MCRWDRARIGGMAVCVCVGGTDTHTCRWDGSVCVCVGGTGTHRWDGSVCVCVQVGRAHISGMVVCV